MPARAGGFIIGVVLEAISEPARAFDAPSSYLFVLAREPVDAAAALLGWADGPPDLCVTSPSRRARATAAFAFGGHFVPIMIEPMLAGRDPRESADDFAARHAQALRIVHAFDTRAALVVCDDHPARWAMPFFADGDELLRRAELIERELPLP
jgi:hypothetical protein